MLIPTVAHVLSVYLRATPDMLSNGLSWYDDANSFARTLDGKRFHRAAGVIAALSPQNKWGPNKNAAAKVYGMGQAIGVHTRNNENKCNRILAGDDALDVLGGDKVRSFFFTIVDPHNPETIPVIDRHAFDIAVGRVTDNKTRGILSRKGVYARFADVYREAALIADIGAPQMQAVTWMQWRMEKGIID